VYSTSLKRRQSSGSLYDFDEQQTPNRSFDAKNTPGDSKVYVRPPIKSVRDGPKRPSPLKGDISRGFSPRRSKRSAKPPFSDNTVRSRKKYQSGSTTSTAGSLFEEKEVPRSIFSSRTVSTGTSIPGLLQDLSLTSDETHDGKGFICENLSEALCYTNLQKSPVPAPFTFLGRHKEVLTTVSALLSDRVVWLQGKRRGVGTSTLAAACVHFLRERKICADGAVRIDARGVRDVSELRKLVSSSLSGLLIAIQYAPDTVEGFGQALTGFQLLLIFEHVSQLVNEQPEKFLHLIKHLKRRCKSVRIMLTSNGMTSHLLPSDIDECIKIIKVEPLDKNSSAFFILDRCMREIPTGEIHAYLNNKYSPLSETTPIIGLINHPLNRELRGNPMRMTKAAKLAEHDGSLLKWEKILYIIRQGHSWAEAAVTGHSEPDFAVMEEAPKVDDVTSSLSKSFPRLFTDTNDAVQTPHSDSQWSVILKRRNSSASSSQSPPATYRESSARSVRHGRQKSDGRDSRGLSPSQLEEQISNKEVYRKKYMQNKRKEKAKGDRAKEHMLRSMKGYFPQGSSVHRVKSLPNFGVYLSHGKDTDKKGEDLKGGKGRSRHTPNIPKRQRRGKGRMNTMPAKSWRIEDDLDLLTRAKRQTAEKYLESFQRIQAFALALQAAENDSLKIPAAEKRKLIADLNKELKNIKVTEHGMQKLHRRSLQKVSSKSKFVKSNRDSKV